ncbi:Molybdopterin-synthase adenylyltransferase [Gammaproteobacteria bacterium]
MQKSLESRYSRQTPLLGVVGQEKLFSSKVLVVGVGGLGSAAAMYLASAGVGHLVLSDYDQVDLSNLQRQIVHRNADVGRLKVDSAQDTLLALNPDVKITTIPYVLEDIALEEVVVSCNAVVDASDNFETRFSLNRACYKAGVPMIYGAALGMAGQVAVFPFRGEAPCYECLYPDDGNLEETCAQFGVLAPLVGVIGTMQALETLKLLAGIGELLIGRVLLLDALTAQWKTLRFYRDPKCPTCGLPKQIL